jgi:hypothetical protein
MPPFPQEMYLGEVETKVKVIVVGERFPDYQYMPLTKQESGERCWGWEEMLELECICLCETIEQVYSANMTV